MQATCCTLNHSCTRALHAYFRLSLPLTNCLVKNKTAIRHPLYCSRCDGGPHTVRSVQH